MSLLKNLSGGIGPLSKILAVKVDWVFFLFLAQHNNNCLPNFALSNQAVFKPISVGFSSN